MKIGGYTINRKDPIISVDKKIYPGDRKRYSVSFTYRASTDQIRPMWKEFDKEVDAIAYINEIEKLIN